MHGFTILDLLVVVAVGFFIYRQFFSTPIGKGKKGRQRQPEKSTVVHLPQHKTTDFQPEKQNVAIDMSKLSVVEKIRRHDPQFSQKDFVEGAKQAYGIYYKALEKADEETLEHLLSPAVFDETMDEIEACAEQGKVLKVDIQEISAVDLVDARVNGKTLLLDVKYTAKQAMQAVKESGKITAKPKEISQIWTWARPLTSDDPNWELAAMERPS